MTGPFDGLTVVEMGRFVSVPFCSQMMAEGGARVIKIEPLSGDPYRAAYPLPGGQSRQFIIKNRGKESLPLDFSKPEGRGVLERLLRRCDVFMLNLSPKAAARNRLDYENVRTLNDQIIYGSVSGFGRQGPDSELAGMDVVAQARSGLLSSLGAERAGVPHHSEVQAADYAASMLLFGGISAALYARERVGQGQEVAVSLLGGALVLQNNSLFHFEDHDGWRETFVNHELPQLREQGTDSRGISEKRAGLRPDPSSHTVHYRAFAAKDGFVGVGAGSPATRRALQIALGGESDTPLDDLPLVELFAERTVAHWQSELSAVGVPVARVSHVDEMPFDEHVLAEGLIQRIDHPDVGQVRVVSSPINFSGTPCSPLGPAPRFAQHARQVVLGLGYGLEEIERLERQGIIGVPNESNAVVTQPEKTSTA